MEEDDRGAKMFLLPHGNKTYVFSCRKFETCSQLFNSIARVIPYFMNHPFILNYNITADDRTKIPITMTKLSSMDIKILYSD
jgi:hypothetical protein